jgi:hypothetical protein
LPEPREFGKFRRPWRIAGAAIQMVVASMPERILPLAALLVAAGLGLAACETTGGPSPQAAAPPPPMTHQQAALDCWMSTEKEAARLTLDKRADIVDACIDRKMKGEAVPGTTAAAKPDAGPKAGAAPKPKT